MTQPAATLGLQERAGWLTAVRRAFIFGSSSSRFPDTTSPSAFILDPPRESDHMNLESLDLQLGVGDTA
jgi:hypothetical protein